MRLHLLFNFILVTLLSGCFGGRIYRIYNKPDTLFNAKFTRDKLTVRGRICSHKEIAACFSNAEDLYHYYYLLHLRLDNTGYQRYTLEADKSSLFALPAHVLYKYSQAKGEKTGRLLAFFSTLLLFPVYVVNLLKDTIEAPYLISTGVKEKYVVVSSHFAFLSAMYGLISVGPYILGRLYDGLKNRKYYKQAYKEVLTQGREVAIGPYKSKDILFLTPRAGFKSDVTFNIYNNSQSRYDQCQLVLPEVK